MNGSEASIGRVLLQNGLCSEDPYRRKDFHGVIGVLESSVSLNQECKGCPSVGTAPNGHGRGRVL